MSNKEWIQPWSKTSKNLTIDGWFGSKVKFNPGMLNPYAWYDANLGGSATQITDSSANARAAVTNGAGSNAALFLPYTAPSVYLPNMLNSTLTTIRGDFTIVARVSKDDWYSATLDAISTQWDGANLSWWFGLNNGTIQFFSSVDNTTVANVAQALPGGLTAGGAYWLKIDRRASDGRVQFFYAADQQAEPSSWTQVGSNVTASIGNLYAGTPGISFGATRDIAQTLTGRLMRCLVRSAGSLVADIDPAVCTQTGLTDSFGNVLTIFRATSGRKTVVQSPAAGSARSLFLLGIDDYLTVPAAALPPMGKNDGDFTVHTVSRRWAAGPSYAALWARRNPGSSGFYYQAASDGSNPDTVRAYDGTTELLTNGAGYVHGVVDVASMTYNAATKVMTSSVNGGAAGSVSLSSLNAFSLSAAPITIGQNDGSFYSDQEFLAIVIDNRVHTATEIAQINAYYRGSQ